jgi:hypothetical protein
MNRRCGLRKTFCTWRRVASCSTVSRRVLLTCRPAHGHQPLHKSRSFQSPVRIVYWARSHPKTTILPFEICGSHGDEDVDVGLLGSNAVWTCRYQRFGEIYCPPPPPTWRQGCTLFLSHSIQFLIFVKRMEPNLIVRFI